MVATGPLNCAKHTQSITSWSDPPLDWRKTFPRIIGVRHDLSGKLSPSSFSHALSWPAYSRYFVPGQPQHIILRGNNRQIIFAAEQDYLFFHDCLVKAAQRFGLGVHP